MSQVTVHVFDVDGTLTKKDSLLLLIQLMCPSAGKKLRLLLSLLPAIPAALLKNDPGIVKLAILRHLWCGKSKIEIEESGRKLFLNKLKSDLRPGALAYIENLQKAEPESLYVLLSASCTEWLQPLAIFLKADLICTELAYDIKGCFTGWFATPNCKGEEKIKRLLAKYPQHRYLFVCYANDASDKALQNISSQFFYRYF